MSSFKSGFPAVREHFRNRGKIYLIGIGVILAFGAAYYIRNNLKDIEMTRIGSGRHLQMDDQTLPTIREFDPTPVLRRLSFLINDAE